MSKHKIQTSTVTVSTVYALSMAKKVFIHLKGVATAVVLKADKVVQMGASLEVKEGEKVVGSFRIDEIQGWHIKDA
jgi:hypothetical protein